MTRPRPDLRIVPKEPVSAPVPEPTPVPMPNRHLYVPAMRGYHVVYRMGEVNFCPGCGRSQWLVGRLMAECAVCGTALGLGGDRG